MMGVGNLHSDELSLSSRHDTGWDRIYHRYPLERLPWELGRPREVLVELVESGRARQGSAGVLGQIAREDTEKGLSMKKCISEWSR